MLLVIANIKVTVEFSQSSCIHKYLRLSGRTPSQKAGLVKTQSVKAEMRETLGFQFQTEESPQLWVSYHGYIKAYNTVHSYAEVLRAIKSLSNIIFLPKDHL